MAHYKIQFLILSFILNVPILYETGLGLAVTAISQYITSWLLTGKMVSSLDFTLQILIFPYCYHGVKAAGNENPLLHNGVWSFLHRDKQAFTTGLCCSTAVSLQVPRGRDGACLGQHAARGTLLAERPPSRFAAMGLCSCSASAVSHTAKANVSHIRRCYERGRVSSLGWLPLPATPVAGQFCENK